MLLLHQENIHLLKTLHNIRIQLASQVVLTILVNIYAGMRGHEYNYFHQKDRLEYMIYRNNPNMNYINE